MDVGVYPYPHGDPLLIDKIVNEFLSQGKFDKLRKECMSDADTKPAYQNLQQRVESTVTQFLKKQVWRPDLNKNQLRDSLRKHILESGFFDAGINRIVDQVVNPNVLATVFMPEVEEVVYNYLSIPRPNDKNPRKVENEKHRPLGNEKGNRHQGNVNYENGTKRQTDGSCFPTDQTEDTKPKKLLEKISPGGLPDIDKSEEPGEDKTKKNEEIKTEISEPDATTSSDTNQESGHVKMELPSDDSQESLSRMGVERLRINESESVPVPDSDDSVPLEINEKSLSDSRDSDDSIINQMSPISQGRLTPDSPEELEPKVEEKIEKLEEKKPLTFIGRIPKIKREDSESSKSSKTDFSRRDLKHGYSSDESDSSKSYNSDEKKLKEAKKGEDTPQKETKKRDDSEKRKKHDDKSSKHKRKDDSSRDRSRDSKDRKRDRSRHRHSKKRSSSSSRERSSSRHKSSHQSRHKDSKSKDHERKKKEDDKKKSKSSDDHGKERNKKEDRRSTDRDSNERERDKATGSRYYGDERIREREQKTTDHRSEKTQKEEVEKDSEIVTEVEEVVIEMEGEWVPEDGIVIVNEDWITSEGIIIQESEEIQEEEERALDFGELFRDGALTRVEFPEITDDFYVKFDSTGFKYFEEWEKTKLDCEEEFKEFVDEAEVNLALISDDESDFEDEFNFEEENRKTIANLLKGIGNFRRTIMFDPNNLEFYRWTNNKFYQKFRKKRERRSTERNESDESIKENIHRGSATARYPDGEKENRERETKALHLKLLNRYKRRAMGHGKHRRRHRKEKQFEGIKEKNENRSATTVLTSYPSSNDLLYKTVVGETESRFLGTNLSSRIQNTSKVNLVGSSGRNTEDSSSTPGVICRDDKELCVGIMPESPDDDSSRQNVEEKKKETVITSKLQPDNSISKVTAMHSSSLPQKFNLALHLPPSPDSDDIHSNTNGIAPRDSTNKQKRLYKSESENGCTPKKQSRRNYSQKYESQDLYKPRPVLNGTRKRGRERGSEPDVLH